MDVGPESVRIGCAGVANDHSEAKLKWVGDLVGTRAPNESSNNSIRAKKIRFETNFYNIFEDLIIVESNFDYFIEFRIIRSNFLIIYKIFILIFLIYNFSFFLFLKLFLINIRVFIIFSYIIYRQIPKISFILLNNFFILISIIIIIK
jgi:hypothetical protein